ANVPARLTSRVATLTVYATERSRFPSPLKSPIAKEFCESARIGGAIGEPGAFEKFTVISGAATGKKTTFERPPPGAGLITVIEAVPAAAMFDGAIVAVSCRVFTNVVRSEEHTSELQSRFDLV